MDPTTYLLERIPGYAELDAEERKAIQEFSLLWSAFEGSVLQSAASPGRLLKLPLFLEEAGRLDPRVFEIALAYWRDRYFADGEPTPHYAGLHMERTTRQNQSLVRAVLIGEERTPPHVLQALLLIVYRLRNNLFHGEKWAYGIRGQRDNFVHASTVMMGVLDAHRS